DLIEQTQKLNKQQSVAYRIITTHFIQKYVLKDETEKPLRMLMTGPGGTGKTYAVNAVSEVLKMYRCSHAIRFLAPTGSAAALIDGMTIHKGLGIKIDSSSSKGKGNRIPGQSGEDMSVVVNIKTSQNLRAEWKHVNLLFIDEASLLSAQLLCEVDYAL
ncbi:hypothetical protein FA15DRAFT_547955, partial [Coprinopsis marcescibilis]